MENGIENQGGRIRAKCHSACCHFVQHGAKGKEVAAPVQFLTSRLLRRHVSYGAHRCSGAGKVRVDRCLIGRRLIGLSRQFRQPEIQNFRRLDVSVHDTFAVRYVQSIGDLHRHIK